MYHQLINLTRYTLVTEDKHIAGTLDSILFDESIFGMQYAVVKTGNWLTGRLVLLSPAVLGLPDTDLEAIPVFSKKTTIESSPSIETHAPVSLKHRHELARYYGWPIQWTGASANVPGVMTPPILPVKPLETDHEENDSGEIEDFPLRRSSEISGYYVSVEGNNEGVIDDIIIETPSWMIRYFVVKEGAVKHRYKLILPSVIEKIDFDLSTVFLDLSHTQFVNAPVFEPETPISEYQEKRMAEYYEKY